MARTYSLSTERADVANAADVQSQQGVRDLLRLREDVTNFDAEQCYESMRHVADFVNEEKARAHLRRSQAQRRARFEMIAWSMVLNRGFSSDVVGTMIGMGLGAMLTGGFGPKVDKNGQTRKERAARRFDRFVDELIEDEDMRNGHTPGMGAPERSYFLQKVLIPMRDARLERAGFHKPVSVDDAATAVWGVRMHAIQEARKPGADIAQVRRDARRQMTSIYRACSADGIRPDVLDGATARVGSMLDMGASTRFVIEKEDGVFVSVMSADVAGTFDQLVNNPACDAHHVEKVLFEHSEPADYVRDDRSERSGRSHASHDRRAGDAIVVEATVETVDDASRSAAGRNPWVAYALNDDMEPDVENYHEGMPSSSDVQVDLSTPARITDALGMLGALDSMWQGSQPDAIENEPVDKWGGMFGNVRVFGDLYQNGYPSMLKLGVDNLNEFGDALARGVSQLDQVSDEYRPMAEAVHEVAEIAMRQHGATAGGNLTMRDVRLGVVGHLRELSVVVVGPGAVEDPYVGLEDTFDEYRELLDAVRERATEFPDEFGGARQTRYEDFVRSTVRELMRDGRVSDGAIPEGVDPEFAESAREIGRKIGYMHALTGGGVRYRMLFAAMATDLSDDILARQFAEGRAERDLGDFAEGTYLRAVNGDAKVDQYAKRSFPDVFSGRAVGEALSPSAIKADILSAYRGYRNDVDSPEAKRRFVDTCAAYTEVLSTSVDYAKRTGQLEQHRHQAGVGRPDFAYGEDRDRKSVVSWWLDADAVESYVETGVVPEGFQPQTSQHPFEVYREVTDRYVDAYWDTGRDIREFDVDEGSYEAPDEEVEP